MRAIACSGCTFLCNSSKIFNNAFYHPSTWFARPVRMGRLKRAVRFVLSFSANNLMVFANAGAWFKR